MRQAGFEPTKLYSIYLVKRPLWPGLDTDAMFKIHVTVYEFGKETLKSVLL